MKVSKSQRKETLIELFEHLGYQKCDSEELEEGFEKVALYTKDNVICTHAARQKSNGLWTSKLGEQIDIGHTIEALQDGIYGNVYQYMRGKVSKNN